ncbi:hypothetical protein niasHT_008848 [Heterodera trifolii]|uniref:Serine/threonine-protein phosphatase n=1 Tax=Heterodera trifolii TaxID=157864 RepID=A0ABD2M178_9BILA
MKFARATHSSQRRLSLSAEQFLLSTTLCAFNPSTLLHPSAGPMSLQYVGIAALILGTAIALFQTVSLSTRRQIAAQNGRSSSGSKRQSKSPSSAKTLAHKIAATIIAEKSLSSIPDNEILQLMDIGFQLLDEEPARVDVHAPCYVFGDIHGNLSYLLKYFSDTHIEQQLLKLQPPLFHLLFLGDYVDRGEFSLEVIALLVSLKILFWDKITLLRGNHEIEEINAGYTFKEEVETKRGKGHGRIYKGMAPFFSPFALMGLMLLTDPINAKGGREWEGGGVTKLDWCLRELSSDCCSLNGTTDKVWRRACRTPLTRRTRVSTPVYCGGHSGWRESALIDARFSGWWELR